ncbi:hypothetical protein LCGC14_1390240 [marine sediment metagenome]|uniref:Uncharacterized protein n=1 Tax=marine sediment metagenome TaxID=412755 RepID=A0A0F9KKZ3_9ZZZZ
MGITLQFLDGHKEVEPLAHAYTTFKGQVYLWKKGKPRQQKHLIRSVNLGLLHSKKKTGKKGWFKTKKRSTTRNYKRR